MKNHSLFYIPLAILLLAGCSKLPGVYPAKPEAKPTTRLTVVSQSAPVAEPIKAEAKVTLSESRSLLTQQDFAQPLRFIIADPSLSDVRYIEPEVSPETRGLYQFEFIPKTADGYRVWAHVRLKTVTEKNEPTEQFPYTDISFFKTVPMERIENVQASSEGFQFSITFDRPLIEGEKSIGTLSITDSTGKKINATGHIIGIYDNFRNVYYAQLGANSTFTLTPHKAGFMELFPHIEIAGKNPLVSFAVKIKSHNE